MVHFVRRLTAEAYGQDEWSYLGPFQLVVLLRAVEALEHIRFQDVGLQGVQHGHDLHVRKRVQCCRRDLLFQLGVPLMIQPSRVQGHPAILQPALRLAGLGLGPLVPA